MSSVYIHFPYCLYKCHYCDFNSHARAFNQIPFDDYVAALCREWELKKTDQSIKTTFFGGGTPSLMPPASVEKLIALFKKDGILAEDAEITLEANPKTITPESLDGFKNAGINRLSMGVQSLNDKYLSRFGRIHTADEAREAIFWIKNTFDNWSIDLIFGFPGQTLAEWQETLKEAVSYGSKHLSCYSFTVEKDAPYSKMVAGGQATLPDEDVQADMFEWTRLFLTEKGFEAYEVSNFAQGGNYSRHNLNYWNYGSYIGLGAGAVSKADGYRTTNFKNPDQYMKSINAPQPPLNIRGGERGSYWFDKENISKEVAMGEFMMMGLRLKRGIDREFYKELFGEDPLVSYGPQFRAYSDKGWMDIDKMALTPLGQMFSNQIISGLMA